MKRALHRSVWFWLGCFVLGFLVWVWVDSWKAQTSVCRMWFLVTPAMIDYEVFSGPFEDGVTVDSGSLIISWGRPTIKDPRVKADYLPFYVTRVPAKLGGEWFAKPVVKRYQVGKSPRATVVLYRVMVPVWGVVVLYLMLCAGALEWRRRRWRRMLLGGELECRSE